MFRYSETKIGSVRVRDAAPGDLDTVTEIYAHYVQRTTATFEIVPPSRQDWSQRFWTVAAAGLPFLVAELDQTVVGYAFCSRWKLRAAYRQTVEDSIYVAPGATGHGVGHALLTTLITNCTAATVRELIAVIVDTGEPASLSLHRRHGFREIGRLTEVGFKQGRWLDTILLQRSLR
ncbi:GNAT family N-acetyltransferase [Microlunatus speluncae]|uniref:GNAT family N-acetyltransferase n=1 Tax=Microlunatus speluncae TaxID=2594267 RepID=UPI001266807E|nr:GNAT family N-acetyltransferase [Microlunatus speluncae]